MTASSSRQRIRQHNPTPDRHGSYADPPAHNVTHQVDLLPRLVVRPETYSTQEEWPTKWLTRIRMGRSQAGIVLQHEHLELEKLFEKVYVSDGFVLEVTCSILEIMAGYTARSVTD